jgi:hypothetical protein
MVRFPVRKTHRENVVTVFMRRKKLSDTGHAVSIISGHLQVSAAAHRKIDWTPLGLQSDTSMKSAVTPLRKSIVRALFLKESVSVFEVDGADVRKTPCSVIEIQDTNFAALIALLKGQEARIFIPERCSQPEGIHKVGRPRSCQNCAMAICQV